MKRTDYILGKFLSEGKTRFVAWCEVEGRRRKCYVPMSTKLSRYFDPVGKEVELKSCGKRLWIERVKLRRRWVWVDAAKAVDLLEDELARQGKTVEREKTVAGYRFDLVCQDVCFEVKCVLSDQKLVIYPNVESARRDEQLKRLKELVRQNVKVVWAFVVYSPTHVCVGLDTGFGKGLLRAMRAGMRGQLWEVCGRRLKRKPIVFVGGKSDVMRCGNAEWSGHVDV